MKDEVKEREEGRERKGVIEDCRYDRKKQKNKEERIYEKDKRREEKKRDER